MSQTARKFTHMSAAEHLATENDGTWRHEFADGAVDAMARASGRHDLVAETERIDRTEKFEAYKRLPSLLEYGLLAQDAMELELLRRRTHWQRESCQRGNTVAFERVGLTIDVSRPYRDIEFEEPTLFSGETRGS